MRVKVKRKKTERTTPKDDRLYTLEVLLIGGPANDKFFKENPVVSRTIQIRGSQTLGDLHEAIFIAFDRDDEHLYEFQLGGKKPHDPNATSYTHPMGTENLFDEPANDAERASIGSLGLKVKQTFLYWFDFGDDWWHRIKVVAIDDEAPEGKFPRVIKQVGKSPPQSADWDEEDEEDEEED